MNQVSLNRKGARSVKIIMMGPQGSGKGTQAKFLGRKFGIPHISTGDLLRAELTQGTGIGQAVQEILVAGRLVPDEIIFHLVEKRLSQDDCVGGFIADGFPRNLRQLLELPAVWRVDHAIQLWIDTQTSVERLATRINCSKCKAIYGPKNPPKLSGVCDNCGGKLEPRSDDAARASVIKRLNLYWSEIPPVLEYYRSGGVLTTLDGNQPIEKVQSAIAKFVGVSGRAKSAT